VKLSDKETIAEDTECERERERRGIATEAKQMPVALLIEQQFGKRVYRNITVNIETKFCVCICLKTESYAECGRIY